MTISPSSLTFGLFGNAGKPAAVAAVRNTVAFLEKRGIDYLVETEVAELLNASGAEGEIPADGSVREGSVADGIVAEGSVADREDIAGEADVVIVFGGDGTLLASIQYTLRHDTPVLGVNLGKLGFMSDVSDEEVNWAIEEILAGRYHVERRMTLCGHRSGDTHMHHALNDIVLAKSGATKVISIDAYVDEEFLASFIADGIIVSTPTGSTAYSLATGGPVVVPSSDVIVISPISAHTLTARPIIVGSGSVITLIARSEEGSAYAMVDGVAVLEAQACIEMEIVRGAHNVALVKGLGPNYFETLRAKLSWAQDNRFHAETQRDFVK